MTQNLSHRLERSSYLMHLLFYYVNCHHIASNVLELWRQDFLIGVYPLSHRIRSKKQKRVTKSCIFGNLVVFMVGRFIEMVLRNLVFCIEPYSIQNLRSS
jgi:hypothetical protein